MFHVKQGREPYATRSKALAGAVGTPGVAQNPEENRKGAISRLECLDSTPASGED